MILRIEELERGVRETKTGKTQTGLKVTGTKFKLDRESQLISQDGETAAWSRFFTDQFDSAIGSVFEQVGVGGMINLKMEKDSTGRFWNPVSAVAYQGSASTTGTAGPVNAGYTKPSYAPQPNKADPTPVEYPPTKDVALQQAQELVRAAVALNAQEKTSLFPKGKMTLDLLAQEVLSVAGMFEKYLEGEDEPPTADTTAVTPGEEGPPDIGDDDVPF